MAHRDVTATSSQPQISGFGGIKRTGRNAAQQIQGYQGPSKPGSDSAPEARASNASFDRSVYQNIVKSMREGK
jgi:hypothetical protein